MQQYRTQYGGQGPNVNAAAATPAQQQPPTYAQPGQQSNPSGADPRAAFEAAMRDYKAKTPAPAVSATRQAVQQATRGPVMPEMHRQAVKDAIEAGYKQPPSQAKPSTVNRVLDGALDRAKLNAELTLSNQQASNNLARRAVGLPEGAELSRQSLANLRQQAGQSYEALRNLGPITPDKAFRTELRDIGKQYANTKNSFPGLVPDNGVAKIVKGANVKTMDSSSAVDAIRTLRERAGDLFAAGNQTAGRAARKTATAIENQLERHLQGTGNEAAVQAFRDARQQIARVHELERVLTPSGNIDAKALGAALKRGKPLTGDMLSIAQAGRTFPTVMRTPEVVGSVPSLGFFDAVVPATLGATTGNVGAMGLILARPAMRGLLSSNRMQQSLLSPVTPVSPSIGFQPGLLSAPISAAGARR